MCTIMNEQQTCFLKNGEQECQKMIMARIAKTTVRTIHRITARTTHKTRIRIIHRTTIRILRRIARTIPTANTKQMWKKRSLSALFSCKEPPTIVKLITERTK